MRELPSWAQIIARYGLKVTRAGASWRGPCPLHGGKNPTAFVITDGRGFFCHSCGENGGVLRFLRLMGGPEATEWTESGFAGSCDAYIAKATPTSSPSILRSQDALAEVTALAPLDPTHPALRARGVSEDLASSFGCGFYGGFGPMRHRLVFPVHDADGRLVGHIGRSIDGAEPRYRFSRGLRKSLLLFNEHRVRAAGVRSVIVVEGAFDVLAVHAAGFPNVVSTLGCQVSQAQLSRLRRFEQVIVVFDADDAGRTAAGIVAQAIGRRAVLLSLPAADPSNIRRCVLASLLAGSRI